MKSKTGAALLLASIFVLGGIAGGTTCYLFQNHFVSAQAGRPRVPNSHDIIDEMAQQLALDAGQKEQLTAIILRSREQYRTLSRQFQPQYEVIRGETNTAIRGILTPDQKKHFDETLDRMDAQHRSHTHEQPSRPPGPPR